MSSSSRASSESLHGSDEPFLKEDPEAHNLYENRSRANNRLQWAVVIPWVLFLVLLAGLLLQGTAYVLLNGHPNGYWNANELEIAKREVPAIFKQIRFTGGLRYNESKQLYRQIEPDIPEYVGIPTPAIDAAWHELISTTDVFLTHEEVKEIVKKGGTFADIPEGDDFYADPYTGLHQAVPTVFHDLHCLDKIRRAIYIDHYPGDVGGVFWPHIEHCIDTIRQSIMCTSDMTPIPEAHTDLKPDGHLEPIFQVHHTCRDYSRIQDWAKGRDALDEDVWRKNAKRLKPGVFD